MINEPGETNTLEDAPQTNEAERRGAVAAAIDRLDLGAIIEASADDALALIREELRKENTTDLQAAIRREILAEYIANEAVKGADGARGNARGFNPDDAAQVEEFVVSQLEGIDFDKLRAEQSSLDISRAWAGGEASFSKNRHPATGRGDTASRIPKRPPESRRNAPAHDCGAISNPVK